MHDATTSPQSTSMCLIRLMPEHVIGLFLAQWHVAFKGKH